eukprot:m.563387 g.563387  ORF g.563387 m.563387 type:complete len:74 (+) comp22230_c1_seq2:245-466(+)
MYFVDRAEGYGKQTEQTASTWKNALLRCGGAHMQWLASTCMASSQRCMWQEHFIATGHRDGSMTDSGGYFRVP